ncbi:MAG: serine hydrolase [Chlorobiales bacterium]|nr:serine hydrolase [Chlorobiales bacterium]
MPHQILISAIFRSRKQSVYTQRKYHSFYLHLSLAVTVALFVSSVVMWPLSLYSQTRGDSLHSPAPINSYIVKEIGSPTILMAKDVDRPVSPASLTKILTCTMAIESGKLECDVLITKESTIVEPSIAGFKPGEKIKLIDLVKAAMVNSSNDAAFAIAIYLSGNVDSFVAAMNSKAKMIGMKNSRFTNPAGFDKGIYAGNTSTAGDLLRLTEYAVKNPVFNEIARLEKAVFTEETTHKVYCLKTHNKLLDKYPYAVGIKTGYTTKAGGCLIARAIKNNKDILLVMLNAKTDRWSVAANMFDTAFLANKPDPAWIVQTSRDDSGSTVSSFIKEKGRAEIVSPLKVGRRHSRLSKAAYRLKRNELAVSKSGRKSKKNEVALSTSGRRSRMHAVVQLKSGHRVRHHVLALAKSDRKLKKHELSSSKQVRRTKKRGTFS